MILVVGGTGTLGRVLVPLLVADGHAVRLLARHPAPPELAALPGVDLARADVRDQGTIAAALRDVDTIVSAMTGFGGADALGTGAVDRAANRSLIDAAAHRGVSRFVLLSVHQAGPNHPMRLFRDKWAAEEALRASGLTWTIVRPTAYLETWLRLIGDPIVRSGTAQIFGRGENPINFVSARDVARVVALALADDSLGDTAIEVPGPHDLTLRQLVETVEAVTGQRARRRHIPRAVLRFGSAATAIAKPVLSAQMAAALVMDTHDMHVDGPTLRARFPTIPMTTAGDVATALFGAGSATRASQIARA
jgi:NADH dehydrogenase